MRARIALFLLFSLGAIQSAATIFGSLKGLIHDPQHRPVQGAQITLRAARSEWARTLTSDQQGQFLVEAVPVGEYLVSVAAPGFATQEQKITVVSGASPNLHFALTVQAAKETVEVSDAPETINTQSSTTASMVSRDEISQTPGASRSNSLSMITDYVPGAYIVHDELHLRGGHQFTWLLDGVPVPNTNIATNVGPQFDPKDVDYIEVQRGGYSAEYGDRTYGVFNVVTRSGFERNRQGELVASYGSYNQTNNQISLGSHTERFAYYGSLSGNRTDLGLETPTTTVLHDLGSGLSGFASLIFNRTPSDQLRVVTAVRGDYYQVPNDPDQHAAGVRDVEKERDAFANFSWVHTAAKGVVLTVSPFYHFNRAHYIGGPADFPVSPEDDRASNYVGGAATVSVVAGKHNAHVGAQGFGQRENHFIGLVATDGSGGTLRARQTQWGNLASFFVEDQYKLGQWITLSGGVRFTRFSGEIAEKVADPRVGAAVRVPRLGWVLKGFYGRYYQPPPLVTVSGPVLELAVNQGLGFLPLRGERDEQHEFGLTIPLRGWAAEFSHFRTGARNFFDHDVLGNSNIFFPVTLERARIRGWETSLRSPRIAHRLAVHLAYSRQYVQGRGAVSGGLTAFEPPAADGYYYLDHDQRDTLSTGFRTDLPLKVWASGNLNYGSGFLDGDGPAHLPAHTTFDLSLGRSFGERWSVQMAALNIGNRRYLLDKSNTFGGTHYNDPRQLMVEVRYRFHY